MNRKTELEEIDIHNLKGRLKWSISRIEDDKKISERNKELILEFDKHLERASVKQNPTRSRIRAGNTNLIGYFRPNLKINS